jgi:hypothetical protein
MESENTAVTREQPGGRAADLSGWKTALVNATVDLLPVLLKAIRDRMAQSGSGAPNYADELTLREAFEFFAENRTRSPLAASAAIVRSAARDRLRVDLMFLDRDQKPLINGPSAAPAASFLVRGLDPEFTAAFGSKDIIVLN